MPLVHERDDAARRIRFVRISDPLTVADLIESAERQFKDGAWAYGSLVDARAMSDPRPPAEIRLFVAAVRALIEAHGPRGPIAFVATRSDVIGSVGIYNFLGGKTESLEVFWHLDDAQQWLNQRMGQVPETPRSS
jgi:hypothetical protein